MPAAVAAFRLYPNVEDSNDSNSAVMIWGCSDFQGPPGTLMPLRVARLAFSFGAKFDTRLSIKSDIALRE